MLVVLFSIHLMVQVGWRKYGLILVSSVSPFWQLDLAPECFYYSLFSSSFFHNLVSAVQSLLFYPLIKRLLILYIGFSHVDRKYCYLFLSWVHMSKKGSFLSLYVMLYTCFALFFSWRHGWINWCYRPCECLETSPAHKRQVLWSDICRSISIG